MLPGLLDVGMATSTDMSGRGAVMFSPGCRCRPATIMIGPISLAPNRNTWTPGRITIVRPNRPGQKERNDCDGLNTGPQTWAPDRRSMRLGVRHYFECLSLASTS
jgi:hypothetical protein